MAGVFTRSAAKTFWKAYGSNYIGNHMGTVAYAIMVYCVWAESGEKISIACFDANVAHCWAGSFFELGIYEDSKYLALCFDSWGQ